MSQSSREQLAQLKNRFMTLQLRDRIIVSTAATLLLLAIVYVSLLSPFYKAVHDRASHVIQKQQDLAWMQSMAPQLRALGNSHQSINNPESLVVVIASTAGRANIASSITGQTPSGNNSVRVQLEGVQFDELVNWLGILQSEFGITVETADINHGSQSGQVNAGFTLTRAAS